MTALLRSEPQSQFDNSNGMLPGQIVVRCERKLYVSTASYLQDELLEILKEERRF